MTGTRSVESGGGFSHMVSRCGVAWSPSVTHNKGWLRSHSVTAGAGLSQCYSPGWLWSPGVTARARLIDQLVQGGFSHTVSRQAPGSGFPRCHGAKWLGHLVSQSDMASVTQWQVPGWLISCWSPSVTACARLRAHTMSAVQDGFSHTVSWHALGSALTQCHSTVWLLTGCHGAGAW